MTSSSERTAARRRVQVEIIGSGADASGGEQRGVYHVDAGAVTSASRSRADSEAVSPKASTEPRHGIASDSTERAIICTLSPITCRCGGTHRPLTTPADVTLEPGQTEAERRTRLLVGARSVGDANRAMTGKPPKCRCSKGARCLACVERDGLTKAQAEA